LATANPAKNHENLVKKFSALGLSLKPARHFDRLENDIVQCALCPNRCRIVPGGRGRCKARINANGNLFTLVYGHLSSVSIDPIEKKPVYHMLPGSKSLSVSTAGCVLSCKYCQNWQISQALPEEVCKRTISPQELVDQAIKLDCASIAFTYNEPTVFFEYMYDTAVIARKKNIKTVMVSCGYINQKPLEELLPVIDVIKVDLKGFTQDFYKKVTGGKLEPVKNTIATLSRAKKLVNIVCLIIPGLNDDKDECLKMFKWIYKTAGPDATLFLSRFYPTYRLRNISPTPLKTLETLRKMAMAEGLRYVYIGNYPGHEGENTYCPKCGKILIDRMGYQIRSNLIVDGSCPECGQKIPGIW
jgi:pyruvate formate lyase activating enzyme